MVQPVLGFTQASSAGHSRTGFPSPETETCQAVPTSQSDATKSPHTWRQKLQKGIESSQLNTYHLIWSKGAWKKLTAGTISLFAVNTLFSFYPQANIFQTTLDYVSRSQFEPLSTLATNIILPFLASACCLLQLWINLLAGGCAGFNTILGPVRPYFLSILFYITLTTGRWNSGNWYLVTMTRWLVALSPELLHIWNVWSESSHQRISSDVSTMPFQANVKLDIPTMGCVACINKINSALNTDGRILEANSELNPLGAKGGYATVRVASQTREELDQLCEKIVQSIEKAGFEPCRIESMELVKTPDLMQ
jgi:copper chaperone CopZ